MDSGFFLCWLLNMFLNWYWGFMAILLLIPYWWFGWSWYPAAAVFGLWAGGTFLVTAFLAWISSGSGEYETKVNRRKNINPYSAKTQDYLETEAEEELNK